MRIAYLDCPSGVSGDMTLGALVDAGVPLARLNEGVASLGLPGVELVAQEVKKHGFRATQITVREATGQEPPQPKHRHLHHIEAMIDGSRLSPAQKGAARRIFRRLAEVEAKVHGTTVQKVHFHEVGAVDSIADIVAAAVGWDLLGAERLIVSPIPTGGGRITIAHGECNVPAPATAELLRGIPLAASEVQAELTTPTGAAIVAELADGFGPLPAMIIEKIGYGAGQRDLPQQANILRLLVGESVESGADQTRDTVWILETNLDDASGEVIGHCLACLWEAGALDVFTTAIQMKKNRPGVKLSILSAAEKVAALEAIVFRETGTLGIRRWQAARHVLPREVRQVTTAWGLVDGKLGRLGDGTVHFAPEYESCRRIAMGQGVPLRDVYTAAEQAFALEDGRFVKVSAAMEFSDPRTLCLIVLAVAAVAIVVLTRVRLARQRRNWGAEGGAARGRGQAARDRYPPAALPDDLARWEVEMHETARELSAQLDAKLGLLQSLIAEAGRAAERLEDALDRAHPTLPPGSQAESLRPAAHARDAQEGESPLSVSPEAEALDGEPSRAVDRGRRREEIYRLADYGFSTADVARRVGIPVGEVELILGLRGRD